MTAAGWSCCRDLGTGAGVELPRPRTNRRPSSGLTLSGSPCAQRAPPYLGAKYRRIATRRGPQKANVAVQHAMLTAIWHMATTGCLYDDPGGDYSTRLNPERARTRAISQLQAIGLPRHPRKAS
jgi:hypothetical protein